MTPRRHSPRPSRSGKVHSPSPAVPYLARRGAVYVTEKSVLRMECAEGELAREQLSLVGIKRVEIRAEEPGIALPLVFHAEEIHAAGFRRQMCRSRRVARAQSYRCLPARAK